MMTNETTQKTPTAATLAPQIAEELGSQWQVNPQTYHHDNYRVLLRDDGLEIVVRTGTHTSRRDNTRAEFQQNYHTAAWVDSDGEHHDPRPYGTSLPEISATLKKSAKQLAREIERRLLPDCEKLHRAGLEHVGACNSLEERRKATAAALGIEGYKSPVRSDRTEYRGEWDAGSVRVRAKVNYPDGDQPALVSVELADMTAEQAKALLQWLGVKI